MDKIIDIAAKTKTLTFRTEILLLRLTLLFQGCIDSGLLIVVNKHLH